MQYNLLNYGNSANQYAFKDPRLSTIIQHVLPDIFGANEIANSAAHSQHLLTDVLGTGWTKGNYINSGNEVQTNMLFWRTDKFGLKSQQSICQNLRDIIAYRLYYKDTITVPHDTVFLTIMVAHLKASEGTQEEAARAAETQMVVNYLNSLGTQGNYILMGDLNLYTSDEQAYQNVINSPSANSKLYDPINTPGDWGSSSSFASVHTQATRTAQLSDGGVNGGMDDRFDFQLVSGYIMNNTAGMQYISNTYKTLGQDGLHYNDALTDPPTNNSAPANVITALYEMSDHLPVYADYKIHVVGPNSVAEVNNSDYTTTVVNPIIDNKLSILFDGKLDGTDVDIQLYTIDGRKHFNTHSTIHSTSFQQYQLANLAQGIYFLRITSKTGYIYFSKVASY
jgi:endonuclease/exonuclease/phosphatase family metal-dependent hydrolase